MRGLRISLFLFFLPLLLLGAAQAQTITIEPLESHSEEPGVIVEEAVPAGPTNLQATAISSTTIRLSWQDNSNNESEFRVELRTPGTSFVDVGAVSANSNGAIVGGDLTPGQTYIFRVRARNADGNSAYSNEASATTFGATANCTPSNTVMCLNNGRFKVEAVWETGAGDTGTGKAIKLTDDSGTFWFFNPDNLEILVKVLNGCGVNARYWVFAGGLTNVRVVLRVTDTATGVLKVYTNPLGTRFQPIQDTNAFASCP